MKCMEYSNKNHVNIIPKKDFEDLVQEVFNVIADNLSKSLGPLGSSATIFDGTLVEATKDGYSILNKYAFHNRYKRMIYNLIKAPCTRMNNTVGDGTTTAIVLTNEIYQVYKTDKFHLDTLYRLPRQFTKAWDKAVNLIIEDVKKRAKPINPEDYDTIYNIAYVTSNGNHEVSHAIAEVYKEAKSPAIKMKDSPTNKSYLEAVDGFEFPTNAIDNCYVRNQDLSANETDVVTMIFDHIIDTDTFKDLLTPLNDVYRAKGHKLVIIAPEYDKYMLEAVVGQYVNYEANKYHELNMILTQYRSGALKDFQREDLAVVLKSKIVTQDIKTRLLEEINNSNIDIICEKFDDPTYEFTGLIGKADSVLITCKNGCIFNINEDINENENYKKALQRAQAELDDIIAHTDYEKQSYAAKIYDARARLLQLQMKNYIYYIGADSDLQKQILYASVEDVIKCIRSAIKSGAVPGCQISIINACTKLNETLKSDNEDNQLILAIIELIMKACIRVYKKVLIGPEGLGMVKTLPGWQYTDTKNLNNLVKESEEKTNQVVFRSLSKEMVFDLESLDYNDKIITSAETDIMVLMAASELIKILISGNQCIFLDSEINGSHQEDVEAYV